MSTPDRWYERAADYAIGLVNPKRAFLRKHWRMMGRSEEYRALWGVAKRTYKNAMNTATGTPWMGSTGSADAEITPARPALVSKSRELNENDPIAGGISLTFVNNVVGTGRRLQVTHKDSKLATDVERWFRRRSRTLFPAENLSFDRAQRMIYAKRFEDGEAFIKLSKTRPNEALWFEVIEADRVGGSVLANATKPQDPEGDIRDGVERDRFGRVVAYWIRRGHPGEATIANLGKAQVYDRVESSVVFHLRDQRRPGQSRAVPQFSAIAQDLRDLDLLIVAALKRSQVACMFAAFISSEAATNELFEDAIEEHGGFRLDEGIEPGMMWKLFPGETIQQVSPNFPSPEFEPFIILLARRIGARLGVSWQIVLKDFSQSNYSSARTDLLEARQEYNVEGSALDECLEWVFHEVVFDGVMRGELQMAALECECSWIGNGWKWVDPQKEATATQTKLSIGLTTLREECAAQGKDWEEVLAQRLYEEKREAELRAELGLPEKSAKEPVPQSEPGADDEEMKPAPRALRGAA